MDLIRSPKGTESCCMVINYCKAYQGHAPCWTQNYKLSEGVRFRIFMDLKSFIQLVMKKRTFLNNLADEIRAQQKCLQLLDTDTQEGTFTNIRTLCLSYIQYMWSQSWERYLCAPLWASQMTDMWALCSFRQITSYMFCSCSSYSIRGCSLCNCNV